MHFNPWKIMKNKIVYENPWISVNHFDILDPSGKKGIYGKVCFKNLAVGIIPIDNEGNIYFVGQYRFPLNEYSWEIPEGGCTKMELPLDTAKRELKEETGIFAAKWEVLVPEIAVSNSVTDEKGIIYLAQELSFHDNEPESTEQIEVKKMKLQEAIQWVYSGQITDSLTQIGLLAMANKKS